MSPDLAKARALAESEGLAVPAEYLCEILRVGLALLDALNSQAIAPAEPVATPPEVKRGRSR